MQKICKCCGKLLDVSNFTRSSIIKDGYENKCKKCRQEQKKKHINICETCGRKFKSAKKEARFCSNECASISKQKRTTTHCSYCGKEIIVKNYKIKLYQNNYCNMECRSEHQKTLLKGQNNPNYNRKKYTCDGCGKEIYVQPHKVQNQKYIFCTNTCYARNIGKFIAGENHHNYSRIKCVCSQCGREFYRIPSSIKTDKVYCSETCHIEALKLYNELRKNKIKHNCEYCDKEIEIYSFELKNKKHIYCSKECKNKGFSKYFSRENSPCWNKNISNIERITRRHYLDYNKWRITVYERDNYTCQCCGDNKGGNLNAHHIYNYSKYKKLRLDTKNGITLCKLCHKKFHDIYGYNNNNLEQLNEFIKNHNVEVS